MKKITQAVLLSAGFGTRLREITGDDMPKVMVPLAGKPLLQHHIENLKQFGISEFFINLHYLPEKITDYFGDGSDFGVAIHYAHEEPEILGTAGGVKQFEDRLKEHFLVLYGDTIYNIDFKKEQQFYEQHNHPIILMTGRDTDHPWDSDLAEIDDGNYVTAFHCKPHDSLPKNYTATGAPYIFSKKVLSRIPANTYFEIDHDLVVQLLNDGENIACYHLQEGEFRKDVGTPDRYREMEEWISKRSN